MPVITIFLRGGADGLSLVAPIGEDAYHRLRPTTRLTQADGGLRLDDRFVLHPDLAPLHTLWESGGLRIEPACGLPEDSRSHFVAQDWLENGGGDANGGWLGRWLAHSRESLAAVAIGLRVPESLRGAPNAVAVQDLAELAGPADEALLQQLMTLAAEDALLSGPSANALAVHRRLGVHAQRAIPSSYPATEFGRGLAAIAGLVHAEVGLRAACIDLPGWDSHIAQETLVTPLRRELATGLKTLVDDLGPRLAETAIVVFTEFGRRASENASLGTDHGRAGCAFACGAGIPGGLGAWSGLDRLDDNGDVQVAHDLRKLLRSALATQGPPIATEVFAGMA
jgi:uncharacterized protein (DUF1501 family)